MDFSNYDGKFDRIDIPCKDLDLPLVQLRVAVVGNVTETDAVLAAAPSTTAKLPKARQRMDDAQRYMKEHQLDELLSSSLREVIRQKPDDPHSCLSNEILKRGAQTSPLDVTRNPVDTPPSSPPLRSLPVFPQSPCRPILYGADEGALDQALHTLRAQATARSYVVELLSGLLTNGDRNQALAISCRGIAPLVAPSATPPLKRTIEAKAPPAVGEVVPPAMVPPMLPSVSASPGDAKALREEVREILLDAMPDGRLENALAETLEVSAEAANDKTAQSLGLAIAPANVSEQRISEMLDSKLDLKFATLSKQLDEKVDKLLQHVQQQ